MFQQNLTKPVTLLWKGYQEK